MGEIKSVKVDNWGVFFLQKLQNFFNKTDYCDLTLQFNDNSQLKVHKLVLSACTDYFNVLEQTCEMMDDILIMPNELQADLVVPIVNFMYTGTLEFELKMYGKLLKTARDMNMTVLLKLLEAHRRTMESGPKQVLRNYTKNSPRSGNFLNVGVKSQQQTPNRTVTTERVVASTPSNQNRRKIITTNNEPYRKLQIKPISTTYSTVSEQNTVVHTKYPQNKTTIKGPSRFEFEGEQEAFDSSFDNISYESKPLKEEVLEDNENINLVESKPESTTSSPFEQLRRTGYTNNKRPASSVLQSPPAKKPNIQDVKEYAEQQRMRKQIAEEYGEEFEDTLDDEFHNDDADDDEEYVLPSAQKSSQSASSKSKQQSSSKKSAPSKPEAKPTIVVKDTTSSNVDHAKIISEVLRKYPHLIKNNKNIKLKIMPNTSGTGATQRVLIKKDSEIASPVSPATSKQPSPKVPELKISKVPVVQQQQQQPQKVVTNAVTSGKAVAASSSSSAAPAPAQTTQPRRIDSKTMKALISLGAENTTGPWLCLRCGINGRPISIPSYRGFRRHLINTHKQKIDPRLCEHCGWRSTNKRELLFHMEMEHQVKSNVNFPKCEHCGLVVLDLTTLDEHIDEQHSEKREENQQCIYCNKTFSAEQLLYNHMKAQHKDRAREDGVIDFSDDEQSGDFDEEVDSYHVQQPTSSGAGKIQILSDINLPKCISLTQLSKTNALTTITMQSNADAESLNIATSLGLVDSQNDGFITTESGTETDGPKFVNAEGNVMELTPAQRDEIISQLEQGGDGVVMVLNDESFAAPKVSGTKVVSATETTSVTSQQFDEDNMLVDYDENAKETLEKEKTGDKDDEEEMDWKNDDSQDESKDDITETENVALKPRKRSSRKDDETEGEGKDNSDLDMKLKLLTGDWTEDEEAEDDGSEKEDMEEGEGEDTAEMNDNKILDILGKSNDSGVDQIKKGTNLKEKADSSKSVVDKEVVEKSAKTVDPEKVVKGKIDDAEVSDTKDTATPKESDPITESETEEFEKEGEEDDDDEHDNDNDDENENDDEEEEEVIFSDIAVAKINKNVESAKIVADDNESIEKEEAEAEEETAAIAADNIEGNDDDDDDDDDDEEEQKPDKIKEMKKQVDTLIDNDQTADEKKDIKDENGDKDDTETDDIPIKVESKSENVELKKKDDDQIDSELENMHEEKDIYKEQDFMDNKESAGGVDHEDDTDIATAKNNENVGTSKSIKDDDDHTNIIESTNESEIQHDEQSQKHAKAEIKNLISEWGEEDDDL